MKDMDERVACCGMFCLVGPTGVGKSTAATIMCELVPNAYVVKVAAPLYDMQSAIYARIGLCADEGRQDGELLQYLGVKVEQQFPGFMAQDFLARLRTISAQRPRLVINDDARPPNTAVLERAGFKLVRVTGPRRLRPDVSETNPNHPLEVGAARVTCADEISNHGSTADLRDEVVRMLERSCRVAVAGLVGL